tara:strand:- start:1223 stop:1753 length:531 start_codon:yes stop_codon:yes gene_type:complete
MYNSKLENSLLLPDISSRLTDFVGIQLDVGDTRVKSACLIAQDLDVKKVIGADNWQRCFEDDENYSEDLFDLVVPALSFLTYSRLVALMQGNYTDSGMSVEEGALSIDEAKSASTQYRAIGESYLGEVVDFLKAENPSSSASMDKSVLRIRSFGGDEGRGTNGPLNNDAWKNRASY